MFFLLVMSITIVFLPEIMTLLPYLFKTLLSVQWFWGNILCFRWSASQPAIRSAAVEGAGAYDFVLIPLESKLCWWWDANRANNGWRWSREEPWICLIEDVPSLCSSCFALNAGWVGNKCLFVVVLEGRESLASDQWVSSGLRER